MLQLLHNQTGQPGPVSQAIIDGLFGLFQGSQMAHQRLQMRHVLGRGLPSLGLLGPTKMAIRCASSLSVLLRDYWHSRESVPD